MPSSSPNLTRRLIFVLLAFHRCQHNPNETIWWWWKVNKVEFITRQVHFSSPSNVLTMAINQTSKDRLTKQIMSRERQGQRSLPFAVLWHHCGISQGIYLKHDINLVETPTTNKNKNNWRRNKNFNFSQNTWEARETLKCYFYFYSISVSLREEVDFCVCGGWLAESSNIPNKIIVSISFASRLVVIVFV